jgi:hypothetical protein
VSRLGFTNWTFADDHHRYAGFLGGSEIGYNHQLGKWVFGLEGDISSTNAHGARLRVDRSRAPVARRLCPPIAAGLRLVTR